MTIDGRGLRVTHGPATPAASSAPPLLAVGDSFTFGEDVLDAESWPACLQAMIDRPVLNGGVTGYGFDQIVLRAEQLVPTYGPAVVVASFIADDVRRAEMRRLWGYDKPWFEFEGDRLVVRGVPVPRRPPLSTARLVEKVLFELPRPVQHLLGYHTRVHAAGDGLVLACRLTERLAALQAASGARVIVMAQYHPQVFVDRTFADAQRGVSRAVLDAAAGNGLATLDTFARLAAEPRPHERLYGALHMNALGNRIVARLVAQRVATVLSAAPVIG